MTDRDIEKKLKSAVETIAPDVMDSILSDCREQKGRTVMTQKAAFTAARRLAAGLAAAFVLLVGGGIAYSQYTLYQPTASVALDVNPSVEIRVNREETVLEVLPLNEDAVAIIDGMDFKGADLTVTVNALIGSMLRQGYLNDLSNSILISVDAKDADLGVDLQKRLSEKVGSLLNAEAFSASILSQTTTDADRDLRDAAEQYGISVGKASLIREITANSTHTMEELAPLSVHELNLIRSSSPASSDTLSADGKASDKSYIGREAAVDKALAHANLAREQVSLYASELDFEDGRMVYEINFYRDGYEYEYDVNAVTGEVLKVDREREDDYIDRSPEKTNPAETPVAEPVVGPDAALSAAYAHAGVVAADAKGVECEPDRENGRTVYEIEFTAGGFEYEYTVDASDGKVLKYQKEIFD